MVILFEFFVNTSFKFLYNAVCVRVVTGRGLFWFDNNKSFFYIYFYWNILTIRFHETFIRDLYQIRNYCFHYGVGLWRREQNEIVCPTRFPWDKCRFLRNLAFFEDYLTMALKHIYLVVRYRIFVNSYTRIYTIERWKNAVVINERCRKNLLYMWNAIFDIESNSEKIINKY